MTLIPFPERGLTPASARAGSRVRLPGPRDRISIMGRTGSGKTHFASWILSRHNWTQVPWIIIDYKRDDLLRDIPGIEEISLSSKLPRRPGLYVVHPRPDQIVAVENLLWRIWEKGRTGLYVDEAHILPDKGGLQAVLTQGRSKGIPAIIVSQRPVRVNRFVFSEADFISAFHLNDKRDRQTVEAFLPIDLDEQLEERHSWYYDVGQNREYMMLPVPDRNSILDRFDARNPRRSRWRKA